jgi:F0F1-type ATP synthase assembly protein I
LSFEIQELPDIVRVIILVELSKGQNVQKAWLKGQIDKVCTGYVCVETSDLDKTLGQMVAEGLIHDDRGTLHLTEQGMRLGKEWASLLLKKEPILEVVAGLVDGSITGLVVIISAFVASLTLRTAVFAAFLTLSSVSITNFSSFFLGGITEDLADMITLQTLMSYSVSDIQDKGQREKSLKLVKDLFSVLRKEINKSNLVAGIISGTTTFLAGMMPILAYFVLPDPLNLIISLAIVGVIAGVFLVRYRSRRSRVHWKVTLLETVVIIAIAVAVSLIIGSL